MNLPSASRPSRREALPRASSPPFREGVGVGCISICVHLRKGQFKPTERADLDDHRFLGLADEITGLRIVLRRSYDFLNKVHTVEEIISHLRAIPRPCSPETQHLPQTGQVRSFFIFDRRILGPYPEYPVDPVKVF